LDSGNHNCNLEYVCVFIDATSKIMKNNFFHSKYFILFLVIVFVFVLISLGRESYRYFKVSEEIKNLENKIKELKQGNEELTNTKTYFNSKEFLEDEARKKLNMVKEGESVIIITSDSEIAPLSITDSKQKISNFKLWFEYFFRK